MVIYGSFHDLSDIDLIFSSKDYALTFNHKWRPAIDFDAEGTCHSELGPIRLAKSEAFVHIHYFRPNTKSETASGVSVVPTDSAQLFGTGPPR